MVSWQVKIDHAKLLAAAYLFEQEYGEYYGAYDVQRFLEWEGIELKRKYMSGQIGMVFKVLEERGFLTHKVIVHKGQRYKRYRLTEKGREYAEQIMPRIGLEVPT